MEIVFMDDDKQTRFRKTLEQMVEEQGDEYLQKYEEAGTRHRRLPCAWGCFGTEYL